MVQWLRHHASTAGGTGSIPGQGNKILLALEWTSLVAQMAKRLSTMQETLGWEDLLEKEMAIHSSTIAWKM